MLNSTKTSLSFCSLALSISLAFSADVYADTSSQLLDLVRHKQYQAAFDLAESSFEENAGDPRFDYLYGLSAQKLGKLQLAAFAFERALSQSPNDINIRLALAIAYYQINNYVAAKQEFETLLSLKISPKVRDRADAYLSILTDKLQRNEPSLSGSVRLGVGHDSNVNSGLGDDLYMIPVPTADGDVALRELNLPEVEDTQTHLYGHVRYKYPINKQSNVYFHSNLGKTRYQDEKAYEKANWDLIGGYNIKSGPMNYKLGLFYQKFWFGDKVYQDLSALLSGASWQYSPTSALGLNLNYSTTDNKNNDNLDLSTRSLAISHNYRSGIHRINAAIAHSRDQVDEFSVNSQHYERSVNSFSVGYMAIMGNWGVFRLNLQHRASDHKHYNFTLLQQDGTPFFNEKRQDKVNNLNLSFRYLLSDHWSWRTKLRLSDKDSNHFFYQYSRNVIMTELAYNF